MESHYRYVRRIIRPDHPRRKIFTEGRYQARDMATA
jgi:hypothetical protein